MTAARGAPIYRPLSSRARPSKLFRSGSREMLWTGLPFCRFTPSRGSGGLASPERACGTHHPSRPTATSNIAPEAVNRNPISAIRIPRYVVPQKKHTAPSAA
jgi:hypothetical protein